MKTLMQYLMDLFQSPAASLGADEAYLAGSRDFCDLELRLRAIEERGRSPFSGIVYGLYTR